MFWYLVFKFLCYATFSDIREAYIFILALLVNVLLWFVYYVDVVLAIQY